MDKVLGESSEGVPSLDAVADEDGGDTVVDDSCSAILEAAVRGWFAYSHWTFRRTQREHFGVRRSQLCLARAQAEHERRKVWRILSLPMVLVGVSKLVIWPC